MTKHTLLGAAMALALLIAIAALTKTKPESWNDIARVASIESLVERGTWAIDDSPWVDETKDKVLLNGHYYSDKMPLMTLLGAGVYAILHGWGASLAPDCSQAAALCAYRWVTLVLVGIPVALLVWLFFDWARRWSPRWVAVLGTLVLALGSMVLPFALVLNHHAPAAASIFASFYLLVQRQPTLKTIAARKGLNPSGLILPFPMSSSDAALATRRTERGWLVLAGFLAALAVSFDALSGIVAVSVLAIALVRLRRASLYVALGAVIPIMLTALLDLQIAGTVVPPYLITNGYNYPGSAFPSTVGGNGTPDDYVAYAFRMFLGGKGLFAYNPLLLLGLAGAIRVALQRGHPLRIEGLFTALGFVVLCLYLATNTGNFGGTGYGERWFVVAVPMVLAFLFFVPPLSTATWKNATWVLFIPLLALSIYSSLQGAQAPWQDWLPPLQMTRSAQFPVFGFRWNVR